MSPLFGIYSLKTEGWLLYRVGGPRQFFTFEEAEEYLLHHLMMTAEGQYEGTCQIRPLPPQTEWEELFRR